MEVKHKTIHDLGLQQKKLLTKTYLTLEDDRHGFETGIITARRQLSQIRDVHELRYDMTIMNSWHRSLPQ